MRLLLLILTLGFLGSASSAFAQLRIGVQAGQQRYMLLEPIDLRVAVENNTEMQTLLHGKPGKPWLRFMVTDRDGLPIRQDRGRDFSDVLLEPGQTKTLRVNITPLYSIRQAGQYEVRAVLSVPGHPEVISAPVYFEVRSGEELWSETRPVDGSMRTYSLIRFSPTIASTKLYLQVVDRKLNIAYGTEKLGNTTNVMPPRTYWDKHNQLHILYTVGLGHYRYAIADDRGRFREVRDYESTPTYPPRLYKHTDGLVVVVGGKQMTPEERPSLSDATFGTESVLGPEDGPGGVNLSLDGPSDMDLPPEQRAAQAGGSAPSLKQAQSNERAMRDAQMQRPKTATELMWGLPESLDDEELPER